MQRLRHDISLRELASFFETEYFCWNGKGEPIGYTGFYTDFPNNKLEAQAVLSLKPKGRILDLGAGRGFVTKRLRDRGCEAIATEISVYCARTRATDLFVRCSITHLPFKDKAFDIAFSIETLEHIPEQYLDQTLDEIARVAERGFHALAYQELDKGEDITHVNIKPLSWWKQKLSKYPTFQVIDKQADPLWRVICWGKTPKPETATETGLNIGSFVNMFFNSEDVKWINIDILNLSAYAEAYGYNFLRHDVRNGLPYPDDSIKYVYATHFLEHLTRQEALNFIKECKRVLKPDGLIRIGVPDLHLLTEKYLKGEINRFDILNPEYKELKTDAEKFWHIVWSGHKTAYDYEALKTLLEEAGFTNIKRLPPFQSQDPILQRDTYDQYPDHTLHVEAKPKKEPKPVTPIRQKLRIALISTPFLRTPPDSYGGLELIVANLGEALAKMGHDVTIFASNGSKVEGCQIIEFGEPKLKVQVDWLQAEREAFYVYKEMLKDFDIIHSHTWFGFAYASKVTNPNLKICQTMHGHLNLEWWGRSKPPFKLNLIAVSDWMRRVYEAQGFSAKFVYNGINLERYPFKRNKGDRLLFVGRIDKFKQPHVAIEVAKKLNMGLDIVGGTFVQNPSYLEQIRQMCDGEQIRFYPDAPHEKKVELIQNAKALLFVSQMSEPFGLVAVEAMSCGTPVVALNDGAVEEVVREGGIVCDVFDKQITPKGPVYNVKRNPVEALVEAVEKVDSIKPEDCRGNAERFSREVMAENYLKRYMEVLSCEW